MRDIKTMVPLIQNLSRWLVIIIHTFQSLVLDAWEKEQKKLEEQGLWKLIYRLNQDQSFESTGLVQCATQLVKKCWVQIFGHILILVIDRSPPLYYLPSLMVPSQERVFVFCYKKLWSAHELPIGWTYLASPANYIENETKIDHHHCSALNLINYCPDMIFVNFFTQAHFRDLPQKARKLRHFKPHILHFWRFYS